MLEQMYKEMEEAAKALTEDDEDDDSSGSEYLDTFSDTYLQDITNQMVNNGQGFGIAEKLYESIKSNSGESVSTES
jgi:Rod binding domain-containing protein